MQMPLVIGSVSSRVKFRWNIGREGGPDVYSSCPWIAKVILVFSERSRDWDISHTSIAYTEQEEVRSTEEQASIPCRKRWSKKHHISFQLTSSKN